MEGQWGDKQREKVILIVGLAYIFPVLLILLALVPFTARFAVLIGIALVVLALSWLEGFSAVELGWTRNNLAASLKAISLPTLGSALLMLSYYLVHGPSIDNSGYHWTFYLFYMGVSSLLQEFLYRGFLFGIFSRAKLAIGLQILLSALLYSFMHVIYRDVATVVLTLSMGLVWGWHYVKFRNLYSVTLSHSLLGAIAILMGII
jgi:uncharacterized protein